MVNRTTLYKQVIIPESSELVIADAPMYWRIGQLDVQGKLRIGSETCRTQNPSVPPLCVYTLCFILYEQR
jgi:hypothetical protein